MALQKAWTRRIGSSRWDSIWSAIPDGNGGIFVTGSTGGDLDGQTNNGEGDGLAVKLYMDNSVVRNDILHPTIRSTSATFNKLILTFSEDIQVAGGGALNPACITVIVDGKIRRVTRSQITPQDHPSIHTASQLDLTLSGSALTSAQSISTPTTHQTTAEIKDLSQTSAVTLWRPLQRRWSIPTPVTPLSA